MTRGHEKADKVRSSPEREEKMGQKIRGQVHSEGERPVGTKPGPREREPRKKGYSMGWSGDRSMSFWEMLLAFMISECVSIKWQKGSQCVWGGGGGEGGKPM